jgi:hypothetical protein
VNAAFVQTFVVEESKLELQDGFAGEASMIRLHLTPLNTVQDAKAMLRRRKGMSVLESARTAHVPPERKQESDLLHCRAVRSLQSGLSRKNCEIRRQSRLRDPGHRRSSPPRSS